MRTFASCGRGSMCWCWTGSCWRNRSSRSGAKKRTGARVLGWIKNPEAVSKRSCHPEGGSATEGSVLIQTRFIAALRYAQNDCGKRTPNGPTIMLFLKWTWRLLRDVVTFGFVNRSPITSFSIILLLVVGLVVAAAQISAPFIYTLF